MFKNLKQKLLNFIKKLIFVVITMLIGAFLSTSAWEYYQELEAKKENQKLNQNETASGNNLENENSLDFNENSKTTPTSLDETLSDFRESLYEDVEPKKFIEKFEDFEQLEEDIAKNERDVHVSPSVPEFDGYNGDEEHSEMKYALDGNSDNDENTSNERLFCIMHSNSNDFAINPATLIAVGEHSNIWLVDNTNMYNDKNSGTISTALAQEIANNTDKIYSKMTQALAPHGNILIKNTLYGTVGDINNDGKINVLLYDISCDGKSDDSFIGGFFAPSDMNGYSTSDFDIPPSDVIHMDIGINQGFNYNNTGVAEDFYGTIAHEFQHMLYYTYFASHTDIFLTEEDLWFNESLSGLADVYYSIFDNNQSLAQVDSQPIAQNLSFSRVTLGSSNDYSGNRGYGDFVHFSNSLKNYGMGYMFSTYMYKVNNEYGNKIYDYFMENLGSDLNSKNAQDFYKNMSIEKIIGQGIKHTFDSNHNAYNIISQLDDTDVFEYFYTAFMESYISDGGDVVVNGKSTPTISFWDNGNLWDFKNYKGYSDYSKLASGDQITLKGFSSGGQSSGSESGGKAIHEMTYELYNDYTVNNPTINIKIGNSSNIFQAYLVLYNEEKNNSDIYPLKLGEENTIDTQGKPVLLFVNTFYDDVSANVNYYWGTSIKDSSLVPVEELLAEEDYATLIELFGFSDIDGHWAEEAIVYGIASGLFSGFDDNVFAPNLPMTRGMFVTVLGRFALVDPLEYSGENAKYNDISLEQYYSPYVNWATYNNIADGVTNNLFAPDVNITREELALILWNFSNHIGLQYVEISEETGFTDNNKISQNAKLAVSAMSNYGIINGKNNNTFDPKASATRAEVSYIIDNFRKVLQRALSEYSN